MREPKKRDRIAGRRDTAMARRLEDLMAARRWTRYTDAALLILPEGQGKAPPT
jgi:hypothetical protein